MLDLFSDNFKVEDLNTASRLFQESKNGFLKLFDNSPICMSMTTLERRFVRVNKKLLETFGYDELEMLGRNSIEVGMLDTAESIRVGKIIKEKGRLKSEYVKCRAKSGAIIHVMSSIEVTEMNGCIYLVSYFVDISKMVEQQAIIEQQNRDMMDSINYASCIQKASTFFKKSDS